MNDWISLFLSDDLTLGLKVPSFRQSLLLFNPRRGNGPSGQRATHSRYPCAPTHACQYRRDEDRIEGVVHDLVAVIVNSKRGSLDFHPEPHSPCPTSWERTKRRGVTGD